MERGKMRVMRVIQKILFTCAMVVGLAMTASAQRDDQKKPPPKDPPVVTPQPKNPPKENPPPEKPKKPAYAFGIWTHSNGGSA